MCWILFRDIDRFSGRENTNHNNASLKQICWNVWSSVMELSASHISSEQLSADCFRVIQKNAVSLVVPWEQEYSQDSQQTISETHKQINNIFKKDY